MRRDLRTAPIDHTQRSQKGDRLNARDLLGKTIIEILAANVAVHGPEVIAAPRRRTPPRSISDLAQLEKLATERAPKNDSDKPPPSPACRG